VVAGPVWKEVEMSSGYWKAEDSILYFIYISVQYSQWGSPSILSQDQDRLQFVVPSGHFLKLPDK